MVHHNRSVYSSYKNLHFKTISSHCKINILQDSSLLITNLHYKRSISCNAKRFSLITWKILTILQVFVADLAP